MTKMTKMTKGFLAICTVMALTVGLIGTMGNRTAEAAAERAGTSTQTSERKAPAPLDRKRAGATLAITDLTHDVTDDQAARVDLQASGVLMNNSKESLDLHQVQVQLTDAEGKVSIPAKIEVMGEQKERLAPGEQVQVQLTFAETPVDGSRLQMVMNSPVGGTVQDQLTITIRCTWPPLRCRITIDWAH